MPRQTTQQQGLGQHTQPMRRENTRHHAPGRHAQQGLCDCCAVVVREHRVPHAQPACSTRARQPYTHSRASVTALLCAAMARITFTTVFLRTTPPPWFLMLTKPLARHVDAMSLAKHVREKKHDVSQPTHAGCVSDTVGQRSSAQTALSHSCHLCPESTPCITLCVVKTQKHTLAHTHTLTRCISLRQYLDQNRVTS